MRILQNRSSSSFCIERVIEHYNQRCVPSATHTTLPSFHMILPPPNVTGNLHLGHALTVVMEDSVEWYPGFDHAGIATQTVVERQIFKEKGILRSQMLKEEFLQHCNEWKDERINTITSQLKKTGASLNWKNCYYTMDERFSSAVTHAFCRLHSDGFIFREKKLINWCPTLRSAISDQEVDSITVEGRSKVSPSLKSSSAKEVEVGVLHLVRYKLSDGTFNDPQYLEVGTTRPETLFADMALAINPNDEKNSKFIGRHVRHPLTDKILPIIADSVVKIDKGTGILKVTPSHDFKDYDIAKRNSDIFGNEYLSCIDEEGKLINAGKFDGTDRLEAKPKIVEELISRGAYGGAIEQGVAHIPVCNRTGDFIEPMLKEQWFMECKEMNQNVLDAIDNGKVITYPDGNRQKLVDWLNYDEPWCLSRQLVWGHQIPAYQDSDGRWIVSDKSIENFKRDDDVLDTWFSSALIPLVVRGWPNSKIDTVPINLMETGNDIIGFWVARMLILCQHLSGKLPFEKILLHGLVRDSAGRKMSKSLGNVIDPLDIIEGISQDSMIQRLKDSNLSEKEINLAEQDLKSRFPEGMKAVGPDALRFALLRHDLTGEDINVSVVETSQEGYRFCNKIWNLINYAEIVFSKVEFSKLESSKNSIDLWILSKLRNTLKRLHILMDADNDSAAAQPHLAFVSLKDFILHDLCDTYLETTKTAINDESDVTVSRKEEVAITLQNVLRYTFAALEPFMPFVTTYLGDKVPGKKFDEINLSQMDFSSYPDIEKDMIMSISIVNTIRSFRAALELPKKFQLVGYLKNQNNQNLPLKEAVKELANLNLIDEEIEEVIPMAVPGQDCTLYIKIEPTQHKDVEEHLQKRLEKLIQRRQQMYHVFQKHESFLKALEAEPKTKPQAINKAFRRIKQAEKSFEYSSQEVKRLEEVMQKLG
uniref:Valine--tRNA ligase n=1 Tax=Panagrolaimus sp. ES5 TaxID=591445 RepID=A0AC34FBT9_9BILA